MTGIAVVGNGVLCVVLMGMLHTSVAVAKSGAYGLLAPQRSLTRAEKRPAEEALLNFKIEAAVDGPVQKGCGADLKLDRERRLLDPQLPIGDRRKQFDSQDFLTCTELDSRLPKTR